MREFLVPPEHFYSDTSNTGYFLFKEAVVLVKMVLLMAKQQFCVPLRCAIEAFYFVITKNYKITSGEMRSLVPIVQTGKWAHKEVK